MKKHDFDPKEIIHRVPAVRQTQRTQKEILI